MPQTLIALGLTHASDAHRRSSAGQQVGPAWRRGMVPGRLDARSAPFDHQVDQRLPPRSSGHPPTSERARRVALVADGRGVGDRTAGT